MLQRRKPLEDRETEVWDLPVRVFHWIVVVSIVGAFVTHRLGVDYFALHSFFGYVLLVAVAFRIIWGFTGSYHARFGSFLKGPRQTLVYFGDLLARRHRPFAGHNPLGALMVLTLLILLSAQAVTGLFADDEIMNTGPLSATVSSEWSLFLTSIHRRLFYVIAAAAGVHVIAVLAHSILFKEKLILSMITGRKPVEPFVGVEPYSNQKLLTLRAVVLCVILTIALVVLLLYATPHSAATSDI